MMLTTLFGTILIALGPTPVSPVRPAADIIEIRPGMFASEGAVRRDQVRYSDETRGEVVAEMDQDGQVNWTGASERERLGGQDAAAMIYVRVFDAVFAIDPFVALPKGDIAASRVLFTGSSLETDRALFDRRRIERTEELFRRLETARVNWLRDNGYYGARTVTRNGTLAPSSAASIEPILKIERPADMPRGRSLEQVDAGSTEATSVASSVLDTNEPVRISLPHASSAEVVAQAQQQSAPADEPQEVASR